MKVSKKNTYIFSPISIDLKKISKAFLTGGAERGGGGYQTSALWILLNFAMEETEFWGLSPLFLPQKQKYVY